MLAVQLRPHVVTEPDKGCPVTITGERLATATHISSRETSVTGGQVVAAGEEEAGEREDLRRGAVPGEVSAVRVVPTLPVTFLNRFSHVKENALNIYRVYHNSMSHYSGLDLDDD